MALEHQAVEGIEPRWHPTEAVAPPHAVPLLEREQALKMLTAIREEMQALNRDHRKELRRDLARAYHIALLLHVDRDSWLELCRDPVWQLVRRKPRIDDAGDALHWVMRYITGVKSPSGQKKASRYATALKPFFEQKIPPHQVINEIKEGGGIHALARAEASRKRATKTGASPEVKASASSFSIRMPVNEESLKLHSLRSGEAIWLLVGIKNSTRSGFDADLLSVAPGQDRLKPL